MTGQDSATTRTASPDALLWLYAIASPFVGAALFLTATSMTKGGGDFCDRSYSPAESAADATRWQWTITIGCVVLIAIGVALMVRAVLRRRQMVGLRRVRLVAAGILAVVATAGLVFLIIAADPSTDCGW